MVSTRQRSLYRRSSYWIGRLRLRRPEIAGIAPCSQGDPDAVRVVATVGNNALHPIFFAKQQIGPLYIGCVAGRENEKVWSSKYIDKGMGRRCLAATREPNGTGRRPPFCATRRAVRLDVTTIDLACLRYPAFPRQRRQDARPGAPAAPTVPAIV